MSNKSRTGRPSKLTRELQERLCALIARGHYATIACAACGIGESTFFRWMEQGEDHLETKGGERILVRAAEPYIEFREAVEKAKATAQMAHMEAIRDAAFRVVPGDQPGTQRVEVKNWTASAWFLERTAPHLFARREVVHQGDGQTPAKPGEAPTKKIVRFGGRWKKDGGLQTAASGTSIKPPE